MSRVDMENRFPSQGRSRIPRHAFAPRPFNSADMENRPPQKKVSRLLQMQANYQDRLMKEKEEKLVQIYENNQRRALQKVNQSNSANQGTVREFFKQRRLMATNPNQGYVPPIQQHFDQMKSANRAMKASTSQQPRSAGNYHQGYQKHSAGIDRSNLLAPITRKQSHNPQTPPVHQKAQMVKSRNSRQSSRPSRNTSTTSGYGGSGSDDTPPPNLSQLKLVHNQRIRKQSADMSDYQKWQADQDREREERLRNYRQNGMTEQSPRSSNSDYEEEKNSELQRQQRELVAQIAAQQAELEEIRTARLKEEAEVR